MDPDAAVTIWLINFITGDCGYYYPACQGFFLEFFKFLFGVGRKRLLWLGVGVLGC